MSDTLMFSVKSSTGVSQGYTPVPLHTVNLTETLTQLLSKKVKLKWGDRCEKALEELYAMLQRATVLTAPDFKSPCKLALDANDVAAFPCCCNSMMTVWKNRFSFFQEVQLKSKELFYHRERMFGTKLGTTTFRSLRLFLKFACCCFQ